MGQKDVRSGRTIWGVFCLLIGAAAVLYFLPFLAGGKTLPSFHWEPGRVTGIPEGGAAPSIHRNFPGKDNAPILVHYPNAAFAGSCLRDGRLPLWNPYVACGTPALGSGQVLPFSPFLWLFYVHSDPWTYTLGLLLGSLWCGRGGYLWLGRFGLASWPRAFGAVLWAFNPYTLRILTFSNVWAAWWFGWLLWAWDRCLDPRDRRWWLPSIMVAGTVYCGHPEEALLLAVGSGVYAMACWVASERSGRLSLRAWVARASGAVALAGILTAVHLLPVLAHLSESFTYKLTTPERWTRASLALESVLNPRSEVFVAPLFWGLAVVGLAGWSAAGAGRRLWPVLVLLVFSILILFRPLPWSFLMGPLTLGGILPGLYARGLFWFSTSALVAIGAGKLWEAAREHRRASVRQLLLGGLAFAGLCWAAYLDGSMVHVLLRPDVLVLQGVLMGVLASGVLLKPERLKAGVLTLGLAVAAVSPLVCHSPGFRYYDAFGAGSPPSSLPGLGGGGSEENHARIWAGGPDYWRAPDLSPNLASLWKARDVRLVDVLVLRRYMRIETALSGPRPEPASTWFRFHGAAPGDLGLLGVDRIAQSEGRNSGRFRWIPVERPLPRAFLVQSIVPASDEEDSLRKWSKLRSSGALHGMAVVEGWSGGRAGPTEATFESINWICDRDDRVELAVTSPSPAVLVLLDTYASGWKATVNGASARIYPANVAFRAVEVPEGKSRIVFFYRPRSVYAGLTISLFGWMAVAVLAWRRRRRG